jgi:hypothetical protein
LINQAPTKRREDAKKIFLVGGFSFFINLSGFFSGEENLFYRGMHPDCLEK